MSNIQVKAYFTNYLMGNNIEFIGDDDSQH